MRSRRPRLPRKATAEAGEGEVEVVVAEGGVVVEQPQNRPFLRTCPPSVLK
jgi:hypothetical protein